MRSWKTWLVIIIVIVLAAGGLYLSRQRTSTPTTQISSTSFTETIAVRRGAITARISPTGEVYAPRSASLSFDVSLGTITELNVKAGQKVKKGDILAKIDTAALQRAVEQAEADLLSAQEELEIAREPYSELDIQKAKLAVAQAELSLAQAKRAKEDLLNPDLSKAEQAVRDAKYELEVAELNLELTKLSTTVTTAVRDLEYTVAWYERLVRDLQTQQAGGTSSAGQPGAVTAAQPAPGVPSRKAPEPITLEEAQKALAEAREELELARLNASIALTNAEARVAQAKKALADAEEELAKLQAGPDAASLLQADNAITQAELKLAKAQAELKTMLAGPDAKKLELAQAKYDAAKATLAEAQAALAGALLVAPFDGTIISVNVEVGDEVTSNRVVLTMADLSELRVRAFVDETKITQVKVEQPAEITFDAFAGKTFKGTVLEVPIQGSLVQNVVVYEVPISLENPERVPLKPGMTANVRIVTGSKQNALLVPAYAVQQTTEGTMVRVQDAGGQVTLVPVEVGLTDGTYTEIVRGLIEGDLIVAEYTPQTQQQFVVREAGGFFNIGGIGRMLGGFR